MHESNTFSGQTTLADFQRDRLLTGEAIRQPLQRSHHEIGGFFEQLDRDGIEAVPLFAAWTMPHGTIDSASGHELVSRMLNELKLAPPLDGLLVAPHGAAVAEGALDFDGFWLSVVRQQVGDSIPIIGTLDLHANLSSRMVAAVTAFVSYRQNPHLDQRERGIEAARLMARTLRGEIRPVMRAAFPPLVANIEAQATGESPCLELIAQAEKVRSRPGILSVSLNLGFPYADVPEMGVSVIVVADGNGPLAQESAHELAAWWWDHREAFRGKLISITEGVQLALDSPGPVCLLDMGDNVGGGSPADSTLLALELLRRNVPDCFVCLYDPEAVELASRIGVGGTLEISLGAKTDLDHGTPIPGPFQIQAIFDGRFEETEARHGGIREYDQGKTAIVHRDGLTIMLNSRRTAPFSLRQLTAFGIDPTRFRVLIAKGVHAPVGAYAKVCKTLLRINTPGKTSADLSRFKYLNRQVPLYPFEEW
jgi:microcystin degradation protein MlrC